jgi:hypothetical protein
MATGRNVKAIAADIAEGYVVVNPIFLKPFDNESLKKLYESMLRKQNEIRIQPFPYGDVELIRKRNMRLQRVYAAIILIRNYAREKRIILG